MLRVRIAYMAKWLYSIQHYVIKFVSDLQQVGGYFPGTPVSSTNKTDHHNITETWLKVALNTHNPNTTSNDLLKY